MCTTSVLCVRYEKIRKFTPFLDSKTLVKIHHLSVAESMYTHCTEKIARAQLSSVNMYWGNRVGLK